MPKYTSFERGIVFILALIVIAMLVEMVHIRLDVAESNDTIRAIWSSLTGTGGTEIR